MPQHQNSNKSISGTALTVPFIVTKQFGAHMNFLDLISSFEKNSPMRYLDYQLTSWGRMLIDTNNKGSYISNYAVIYKNCNIDDAIAEIEKYYASKNIVPKIFYRQGALQLDALKDYFQKYCYSIREFDIDLMILDTHSIKQHYIGEYDIKIAGDILKKQEFNLAIEQDDGKTYGTILLNRQIAAGNKMFFAYNGLGKPVSMALAEKYHNAVYISSVYTIPSERRKGYCMAVINEIILNYSDCFIYLYTNNPEAANIYRKLGFSDNHLKSWWAVKGSLPDWCSTNNKKEQ